MSNIAFHATGIELTSLNAFIYDNDRTLSDLLKFKLNSLFFQLDRHSEGIIFLNDEDFNMLPADIKVCLIKADSDKVSTLRRYREDYINSDIGYEDFIQTQLKDIAHFVQYEPQIAKDLFYVIHSIGHNANKCDFVKITNDNFFTFIECYYNS